jgi:hypothetical protein
MSESASTARRSQRFSRDSCGQRFNKLKKQGDEQEHRNGDTFKDAVHDPSIPRTGDAELFGSSLAAKLGFNSVAEYSGLRVLLDYEIRSFA